MRIFFLFIVSLTFSQQLSVAQSTTSLDSLDLMIGQMIMTGIGDDPSITSNQQLKGEIEKGIVGGVILFEKNIDAKSPESSLTHAIDEMQSLNGNTLLVGIDEEGGLVNRLKPKYGFPKTVSAEYLGELDDLDSTRFYADRTAVTLKRVGINVNFAPSVDVAVYKNNPVIAGIDRSFSENEEVVARHAKQVIKAHRKQGVLTTIKHFPGHGSSHSDSHLGVADVTKYWEFRELTPYRKLIESGQVDCIMSAHIVNKHLDPKGYPATLSPYIIREILRETYKYNGVVFSDDMQMHAISSHYGFEESIRMAIEAGIDILMFCNNVPGNERRSATEIQRIIRNFVDSGGISEGRIRESYNRIQVLKSKL